MRICSIDDCEKPARRRGWCGMHHQRWLRNGAPVLQERVKRWCTADGCDRPHKAKGLCNMHLLRWERTGSPHIVRPSNPRGAAHQRWCGDNITYGGAHRRLRAQRGSASNCDCRECGAPAADWAYTHNDPNEKVATEGPYSTDPNRYVPMCKSCHKRFDLDYIKEKTA